MALILCSIVFLLPVLLGIGEIFQRIFGKIFIGLSAKILSGVLMISTIWSVIAFFHPLNIYVELITIFIGLFTFFYFKIYDELWRFAAENFKLFSVFFISIIFFSSYYPFILDHFGYYVPTIKWLAEVGLVQGISNLDLLLGQNSLWHIFQAGFSNFSDPFLRLNALVLVIYLFYIFEKKSWIQLVFLPVLFLFSQSPSPDLSAIIFSLIILNEVLLKNKNISSLFALSIFVFAIKPTMIWVPILVFLYSFLQGNFRVKSYFLGTVLLLLFIVKNIWTFGFPIFPVQILDFGVAWKPNAELLKNSSEMAIMKTYDLQYSFAEINRFSKIEHVKNWLFLPGIKGKIHILFIFSLLLFLGFAIQKKSKLIWIFLISIFIKSVLILLFSAQYRFFLDVFFVIFFVVFSSIIVKKYALIIYSVGAIFFAGILSFPNLLKEYLPSFRLGSAITGFQKEQFLIPSHFTYQKFTTHQVGNLKFNVVKDYPFSFETPIPAISPSFIKEDLDAGIFPQLRGKTIKEGFIWRTISESEKHKLQLILNDFKTN